MMVRGKSEVSEAFRSLKALEPVQLSQDVEYLEGRIRIRLVQQYTVATRSVRHTDATPPHRPTLRCAWWCRLLTAALPSLPRFSTWAHVTSCDMRHSRMCVVGR